MSLVLSREELHLLDLIDSKKSFAVQFLQSLVQIDSTFIDQGRYGRELECQKWLEEQLCDWGLEVDLFEPDNEILQGYPDFNPGHDYSDRPNLVAICRGSGGGRSIILNGHIDTVPVGDPVDWSYGPFSGDIVDGKLYGRGAADMKAGLCAQILATKFLCDAGLQPKGDITIQSVVDEEGGGNGTLACLARGDRADAAIVAEPTNLDIFVASRGVYLLEMSVRGRAAHASQKWHGVSAVEKAIKIIESLHELEHKWLAQRRNPIFASPTITVGQISGGISAAVVPDSCVVRLDIKYLPVELDDEGKERRISGESVVAEVEECIRRAVLSDPWLSSNPPELNWYLHVMPHYLDPAHPFVGVVSDAVAAAFEPRAIGTLPCGADARHLQNTGGIPTIIFGPGNLKQAHSVDEYVQVDQFIAAIKALALIIHRWTSNRA